MNLKNNIKIEFYRRENGKVPVIEFLNSLEKKSKVKAVKCIEILAGGGNALRPPVSKHLTNGIFELRIRFSNDISRILFFFWKDGKIIITNGFIKKTEKIPAKELKKAINYKKDFEERYKDEKYKI